MVLYCFINRLWLILSKAPLISNSTTQSYRQHRLRVTATCQSASKNDPLSASKIDPPNSCLNGPFLNKTCTRCSFLYYLTTARVGHCLLLNPDIPVLEKFLQIHNFPCLEDQVRFLPRFTVIFWLPTLSDAPGGVFSGHAIVWYTQIFTF